MDYVISALMLLGGYVIAEIIRRINRAESFSEIIFEKRLYAFLELYRIFNSTYEKCSDFLEAVVNEELEETEETKMSYFDVIEPLLRHLDANAMFFSEELSVQCGAAFLGPEEFTKEQCQEYLYKIRRANAETLMMIKNESGMTMLNKKIKRITGYKHSSPVIKYYTQLKKEQAKQKQK